MTSLPGSEDLPHLFPRRSSRSSALHPDSAGRTRSAPRILDPKINRFVGADQYAASVANLELQIDPLTGNRYLYAGANPVNLIDDGHSYSGCTRMSNPTTRDYLYGRACTPDPRKFRSRFGYMPEVRNTQAGWRYVRPEWAAGGCSNDWFLGGDSGYYWDFHNACMTHDYGYDLWRFGRVKRPEVDSIF